MYHESQIVWAKVNDIWWPSKVIDVIKEKPNQNKFKFLVETFATSKKVKLEDSFIEDFASKFEKHSEKRDSDLQFAINEAMNTIPFTRMRRLNKFQSYSENEHLSKYLDSEGNFNEEQFELENRIQDSKSAKAKLPDQKKAPPRRNDTASILTKIKNTMTLKVSSKKEVSKQEKQKNTLKSPKREENSQSALKQSGKKTSQQKAKKPQLARINKRSNKNGVEKRGLEHVEEHKTPEIQQKEAELKSFLLELTKEVKHKETSFIFEKPSELKNANKRLDDLQNLNITAQQHISSDVGKLLKVIHDILLDNQSKLSENGKLYMERVGEMINGIKTAIAEYYLDPSEIEKSLKTQIEALNELKFEEKIGEITTIKDKTPASKRKEPSVRKSITKSPKNLAKPKTGSKSKPETPDKDKMDVETIIEDISGPKGDIEKPEEDNKHSKEAIENSREDIEESKKDIEDSKMDVEQPKDDNDIPKEDNKDPTMEIEYSKEDYNGDKKTSYGKSTHKKSKKSPGSDNKDISEIALEKPDAHHEEELQAESATKAHDLALSSTPKTQSEADTHKDLHPSSEHKEVHNENIEVSSNKKASSNIGDDEPKPDSDLSKNQQPNDSHKSSTNKGKEPISPHSDNHVEILKEDENRNLESNQPKDSFQADSNDEGHDPEEKNINLEHDDENSNERPEENKDEENTTLLTHKLERGIITSMKEKLLPDDAVEENTNASS